MKNVKKVIALLLITAGCNFNGIGQVQNTVSKNQLTASTQLQERSKSINEMMKGVSLVPRTNATADDKRLLKQFEKVRKLSLKVEGAGQAAGGDLGQQLQLALQESNNIAKLRKTGNITLFPNDCYDQCDDQVGSGAAWNEFFCVFKCFKAATVDFD